MVKRIVASAAFIASLYASTASAQDVTLLGGSAAGGFPFTLGSTLITAGSITPTLSGLTLVSPLFTGTAIISGATTTGPDYEAQLTGDTFSRIAIGMNTADVPRLSFGPGNAARDVFLERLGAGSLRHGAPDAAAPIAQTISVQNVVAGTSNTAGALWTFKDSIGTGTGLSGGFAFQVARAGTTGSTQNTPSNALTIAGGTGNVGVVGASFGLSGSFNAPAWTTAGIRYANVAATITDTTSSGTVATAYTDLFGGNTIAASSATTFTNYYTTYIKAPVTGTNVTMTNKYALGVDSLFLLSTGSISWNGDTILSRDAAGILAQVNGVNAQTFRLYNTFTDASNYERGIFDWQGSINVLSIGTEKAGTGSARNIRFLVGGVVKLDYGVLSGTEWTFGANILVGGGGNVRLAGSSNGIATLSNNANTDFGRLQLGGTTSSFPAIKRSSAALAFRLADDSADAAITSAAVTSSSTVKTAGYAIASLPAGTVGMRAYVTDQLTTCAGAGVALTAGGAAVCPVFYNGTIWTGD